MRDTGYRKATPIPTIEYHIQTLGILEASRRLFESISSVREGKEIRLFILYIGSIFYKALTEDERMSYPGHNGFSLVVEELESNPKIDKFLKDAADRGYLIFSRHTSKNIGKMRCKWYLNPLLSPYFKIPAIHTKEPMYINIQTLDDWLVRSRAFEKTSLPRAKKSEGADFGQQRLF